MYVNASQHSKRNHRNILNKTAGGLYCTFVMLFLISNTEYGFIGVHWGFTPTPGIILNTHTMINTRLPWNS